MGAVSHWEPGHLASELRRLNPDSAHLDDDELLRSVADDYPGEVELSGETVTTPRPDRVKASEFVASIRSANPEAAQTSAQDLIMQAAEENPGAFHIAGGFVHITQPDGDIQSAAQAGIQQGQQETLAQPAHQQPRPQPTVTPTHGRTMRRTPKPAIDGRHTQQGSWKAANERVDFNRRAAEVPAISVNTGKEETNFASLPYRHTSAADVNALVSDEGSDANDARKVYGQPIGAVASDAVTGLTPPPISTTGAAPSASGVTDSALEASDTYLTPEARAIARGGTRGIANVADFGGALLGVPAAIDRGWQWLMGQIGVDSADGIFAQAQDAAHNSAATMRRTADADLQNETNRYGSQPLVNQVVEGGTEMAVDLATKYKTVGWLIKASGGAPTASKVMALVNGINSADKGTVETVKNMASGFIRGHVADATVNYSPTANAVVQGTAGGGEALIRTGDLREAGKAAVLQGGMAASQARGGRSLLEGLQSRPVPTTESTNAVTGETIQTPVRGGVGLESGEHIYSYLRHPDGVFTIRATDSSGKTFDVAHATAQELPDIVGGEAAMQMIGHARGSKLGQALQGIINLPKALVTSADISAPGRQGIMLAIPHPVLAAKAFGAQIKALYDGDYARSVHDELMTGEGSQRRNDAGLYMSEYENAKLGKREEAYASQFAENLPIVKQSNRAYSTFLNKLRSDVFDKIADGNPTLKPEDLQGIARFINYTTGRGDLGRFNDSRVLNNLFFSPKYLASRFQALASPVTAETAPARKIAAVELTKFFGGGIALMLAAKAGGLDVEADPRSTNFGRISVGNHHYDLWGGYANIARHFAQIVTGQAKDSGGDVHDIDRAKNAFGFLREKLAPVPAAGVDIVSGKNVRGDETTAGSVTKSLVTPYAWADITESIKDDLKQGGSGVKGALMGSPSLVGVGTSTYEAKPELDKLHKEIKRLRVHITPEMNDDETPAEYFARAGTAAVGMGRAMGKALDSEAYKALPDDAARKDALAHVANYTKQAIGEGLPDDFIDQNSEIVLEQHRLNSVINDSDWSAAEKQRARTLVEGRFKVLWMRPGDTRKIENVRSAFIRRRAGNWLVEAMGKE